jgi:hypothetical protein
MARRHMYRTERLDAFLGLQISLEMDNELEREAARINSGKGPFTRLVLSEGLEFRRLKELRVFAQILREADNASCSLAELLSYILSAGLASWRSDSKDKARRRAQNGAAGHAHSQIISRATEPTAAKRGA